MVERYHLALAAISFVAGVVAAILASGRSSPIAHRALALSVAAGATLGGAVLGVGAGGRSVVWLLLTLVAVGLGDDGCPAHPLGRWVPAATVMSLAGIWSAVPDTEPALAVLCSLTPVAVVWLLARRTVGPVGTAALVVGVLGATWTGSADSGAALATGCAVAMVLVAPLVIGFGRELRPRTVAVLASSHVLVALLLPRQLMRRPALDAAMIAVGALVALAGLAWTSVRAQPRGAEGGAP